MMAVQSGSRTICLLANEYESSVKQSSMNMSDRRPRVDFHPTRFRNSAKRNVMGKSPRNGDVK